MRIPLLFSLAERFSSPEESRFHFSRLFPHRITSAVMESPYAYQITDGIHSSLFRRVRGFLPGALAAAMVLLFISLSGLGFRPASLFLELYVPLRVLLLYRAARLTVAAARHDLSSGNLEHLAVSPMSGCDLAVGWAIAGWCRALPETLAVMIFVSPLILAFGPIGGFIACVDLLHLVLLQGLAALITASLMAGFQHRHEAATAGWISAVFTYPLVFLIQSIVMGMLFALLPLSILLLLGASSPAGWPDFEAARVVRSGGFLLLAAYAVWLPVATMKEIDRQLDLAEQNSHGGLQRYLQGAASPIKAN